MVNTHKLFRLLSNLSVDQFKDFGKFLRSPYFNTNRQLIGIYNYIHTYHPGFDHNGLSKKAIFRQVFRDTPYRDQYLRKHFSAMTKLAEEFLAVEGLRHQQAGGKFAVVHEMVDKGQVKLARQELEKLRKKTGQGDKRDAQFYLESFEMEKAGNKLLFKQAQSESRVIEGNFKELLRQLDCFYLINKLRYCCQMLDYGKMATIEEDVPLVEEILAHLNNHPYSDVPAIQIYHHILQMLLEDDAREYDLLKATLEKHATLFEQSEAREMYICAQNYCIRKVNQGEGIYLNKLFELYKAELHQKIILDDGKLSPWDYKNITVVGLRLKEFKWVDQFLSNYRKLLPAGKQENAYTYNRAKYHFYKGDYERVISLLHQVEYDDVFYNLDSRSMLLKTYYEQGETEAMLNMADSFRTFIHRKKDITAYHREAYLNLLKFTRLIENTFPQDKVRIAKIKRQIKESSPLADKAWLKEKLAELE